MCTNFPALKIKFHQLEANELAFWAQSYKAVTNYNFTKKTSFHSQISPKVIDYKLRN